MKHIREEKFWKWEWIEFARWDDTLWRDSLFKEKMLVNYHHYWYEDGTCIVVVRGPLRAKHWTPLVICKYVIEVDGTKRDLRDDDPYLIPLKKSGDVKPKELLESTASEWWKWTPPALRKCVVWGWP